jgi:hypothetical protein
MILRFMIKIQAGYTSDIVPIPSFAQKIQSGINTDNHLTKRKM